MQHLVLGAAAFCLGKGCQGKEQGAGAGTGSLKGGFVPCGHVLQDFGKGAGGGIKGVQEGLFFGGLGLDFVGSVLWPLIGVWLFTIFILAAGVQKGVARASTFFMPLLVVMFVLMVGISLTLPGATKGSLKTAFRLPPPFFGKPT